MKIISKFQDYYDIGLAYGVDEKLRFERKTWDTSTTLCEQRDSTKIIYRKEGQYYRIICHYNLILFCGKAYPLVYAIKESITKKDKKCIYKMIEEEYCYTLESIDLFMQRHYKSINSIGEDFEILGYKWWAINTFNEYTVGHFEQDYTIYFKLFMKYKMPYLYIENTYKKDMKYNEWTIGTETTLLPQLKQYKFAKAVAPMQAFQEISMFLGQLNLGEDNTVTIDDRYLAQGKGFDCYSFKKMPSKRKVKSC